MSRVGPAHHIAAPAGIALMLVLGAVLLFAGSVMVTAFHRYGYGDHTASPWKKQFRRIAAKWVSSYTRTEVGQAFLDRNAGVYTAVGVFLMAGGTLVWLSMVLWLLRSL